MVRIPTEAETAFINQERAALAEVMAGTDPENQLIALAGPCASDADRLPNGAYATEAHLERLDRAATEAGNILLVGRLAGTKPRSNVGPTGLIHEIDGPAVYTGMAHRLTSPHGIPLAAEILNDTDLAVAGRWLTAKWTGARNAEDTGVRYLARPTSEDLDTGLFPAPVFVKNGSSGSLDTAVQAITTIKSETPVTRSQLTLNGLRQVTTLANPHVGLILRGGASSQDGQSPKEALLEEIWDARERMAKEFGDTVPIIVDLSHGNAKRFGGNEAGQMACARALAEIMMEGVVQLDGFMAETYIRAGKQNPDDTVPGLSRTDACLSQSQAGEVLTILSDAHGRQLAAA